MYLSHYHLKVKPFQINPDPKFLWLGESHRQALSMLKKGIAENKGLILLVGDVGTGKTTLINKLLDSLDENTLVASVQYPGIDILDFYNFLADSFKMGKKFSNKGDFLVQFIHFLHKQHSHKRKVVLVIDEAQGLSDEILGEIRLLSNLERGNAKLLNILLVGQDEMNAVLANPPNERLVQSIAARYYLGPLQKREVRDYIHFRLEVAGGGYRIFNKGAIREIAEYSKCYPRLINVICDHALLTGYVQGKQKIDAAIIRECAKEHQLDLSDESEAGRSDLAVEKDAEEPPVGAGGNYHWALPAILVLALVVLSAGGYLSYLKGGDETFKPVAEEPHRQTPSPAAVPDEGNPVVEETQDYHTDETPVPLLIEEDLGEDRQSGPNQTEAGEQNRVGNNAGASVRNSTEEKNPVPAAPSLESKLVLRVPPYAKALPQEAYARLDQFVLFASRHPQAKIMIRGYSDSSGGARQNKMLSQLRADAVKTCLVTKGLKPTRIDAVGYGEENPIASNATLAGRNLNRRIEIELVTD